MDDPLDRSVHAHNVDRMLHATLGRITQGISPASLSAAFMDWAVHLAGSPGKQQELLEKAVRKASRFALYTAHAFPREPGPCIQPLPQDQRFSHPGWCEWPFNLLQQTFLLTQQWWHNATTEVRGVTRHHQQVMTFTARQLLDMLSPSNVLFTNPEVLQETVKTGGMNLVTGGFNWWNDVERLTAGKRPEGADAYQVGHNVAITPGQVVYRNRLIELIQYAPASKDVYAEPVLIVPSWIMKYYILDLSPHDSLVKFLVAQGHTVFMISWKNPTAGDRDLGMDDYLKLGPLDALNVVSRLMPKAAIHAAGYCLGGTLLAIAAAHLARRGNSANQRIKTISLFASEVDFEEPGELSLFIDESQIAYLEDIMWDQGYLDGSQMGGAFQLLNSKDLIWSRLVHDYLMGIRPGMNDLMAWNADRTRLPFRMHSEYLRSLYLNNDLAEGRYLVDGKPVALTDIRAPVFSVGTLKDHVSPWRSVYKIHLLTDTEVTFVLTSGGHNAGIVSEPGHPGRSYQIKLQGAEEKYLDPDSWLAVAPRLEGSWWPTWRAWLAGHSSAKRGAPPPLGNAKAGYPPLADAPGRYVLQA